jgi:hypothetical protein
VTLQLLAMVTRTSSIPRTTSFTLQVVIDPLIARHSSYSYPAWRVKWRESDEIKI